MVVPLTEAIGRHSDVKYAKPYVGEASLPTHRTGQADIILLRTNSKVQKRHIGAVSRRGAVHGPVDQSEPGFTLVELLVVIAIIGLLAALLLPVLLLPVLSRAREQAHRIVCLNNSHQINLAVLAYLDVNEGIFPAANSSRVLEPEDWLYWSGRDPTVNRIVIGGDPESIKKSPITRYTGGFNTNLFRCPTDRTLNQLDNNVSGLDLYITSFQDYRFSYSLNRGGFESSPGMASEIIRSQSVLANFHASSISRPSLKIMLAEQRTILEGPLNRTYATEGIGSGWIWTNWDARFPANMPDRLASRHNGKGNQAFADGHVETVKPEVGLLPEHCDPRK